MNMEGGQQVLWMVDYLCLGYEHDNTTIFLLSSHCNNVVSSTDIYLCWWNPSHSHKYAGLKFFPCASYWGGMLGKETVRKELWRYKFLPWQLLLGWWGRSQRYLYLLFWGYSDPAGKREPWGHFPTCSECIRRVWRWNPKKRGHRHGRNLISQFACSSIAANFLYSSLSRTEFIYYVLLPQKGISPFNLFLQIGNLFGKHRSTIITLYNGAFDSSSAIFLIIKVGEKGFFVCLFFASHINLSLILKRLLLLCLDFTALLLLL